MNRTSQTFCLVFIISLDCAIIFITSFIKIILRTSRCRTTLTPYFLISINFLLSLNIEFRFRFSSFQGCKNKESLMLKCSKLAFKNQSTLYFKVIETSLLLGQHFVHHIYAKSYYPFCEVYLMKKN